MSVNYYARHTFRWVVGGLNTFNAIIRSIIVGQQKCGPLNILLKVIYFNYLMDGWHRRVTVAITSLGHVDFIVIFIQASQTEKLVLKTRIYIFLKIISIKHFNINLLYEYNIKNPPGPTLNIFSFCIKNSSDGLYAK